MQNILTKALHAMYTFPRQKSPQKTPHSLKNTHTAFNFYQIHQKIFHPSIFSCYICDEQTAHEMDTITYEIDLGANETTLLPTFTSSVSLVQPKPLPVWVKTKRAVSYLKEAGYGISDQTLYNMAREGRLTIRRKGERIIEFDLNEIAALAASRP